MRLVLIYPPPWKIAPLGNTPYPAGEGQPEGGELTIEDADFSTIPYGLLSLAAQTSAEGHSVLLFNLSLFAWPDVEDIVEHLNGDVFGLASFTVNRRGVDAVSRLIRRAHPTAHITIGGPHATALPAEMLNHYSAIDSVVVGEGEKTLAELLQRLESGPSIVGMPGLACRHNGDIQIGPPRPRIDNLDSLPNPLGTYPSPIIMTSRGCPNRCSFCASHVVWGHALRFHSAPYVLDLLETAVCRHGFSRIAIKDDTFTANKRRVLEICRGIKKRGLRFVWSCDTRADALDEPLLIAMRQAGCQKLCLGVESGSPDILKNINKRTTPALILRATRLAQRFGFDIRYYMMLGNNGETKATLQQSLDFLEEAKPNEFTFSLLAGFPGTDDFDRLVKLGRVASEVFFNRDTLVPVLYCGDKADMNAVFEWYDGHQGYYRLYEYTADECRRFAELFQDLAAAYLDLGGAYFREGDLDEAERLFELALLKGYPIPGMVKNYLACLAATRGDLEMAQDYLSDAVLTFPHRTVLRNQKRLEAWLEGGADKTDVPSLIASHDFEPADCQEQPFKPGPIVLGGRRFERSWKEASCHSHESLDPSLAALGFG